MATPTARPNVIVFFTDQQRWDTTGVHGNPLGLTPNFDRMALRGTHLYNAFTCQPVCAPARAHLQTGLYATNTGGVPQRHCFAGRDENAGPLFRVAGYRTGYIGKWHLADAILCPRISRAATMTGWAPTCWNLRPCPITPSCMTTMQAKFKLPGYRVDALTDEAIRYICTHKDEPFYLFLSFLEPHHQNHVDDFVAPDGYREQYAEPGCRRTLRRWADRRTNTLPAITAWSSVWMKRWGGFMDALKSLKLDDNTIVLFTSDHGCHFKTRNSEYKRSCHESSSVHIPTASARVSRAAAGCSSW